MTPSDLLTAGSALVGQRLNEPPEKITAKRKGSPAVARARQFLAYLLHTEASLDKQAVGTLLGRHRSTIGHAVDVVEDFRDTADGVIIDELANAFRMALPAPYVPPAVPRSLSDPLTSAITQALTPHGLYGPSDSIETDRDGDRIKIKILLKAACASSRTVEESSAHAARRYAARAAEAAGYVVLFSDAMFASRGTAGWSITLRLKQSARR